MSTAAFSLLWCFVFVLPWDALGYLPVLGSLPRLVGLVASGVGIVYILARRRLRPPGWFHLFAVLFVLWAGVSSFWSLDPGTTRARVMTYLQLVDLASLIWQVSGTPALPRVRRTALILCARVAS